MNEYVVPSRRNKPSSPAGAGVTVVDLPYRWLRTALATISLIVIGLGILRKVILHWHATTGTHEALQLINLVSENSLPEWWSVTQFSLAAILLVFNGMAEPNRRWKSHWFILAAIFVFLSIDESAGVHEIISNALVPYHFTSFLLFAWVIPYAVACLAIGVFYIPFVSALPHDIRPRVILAGGLFMVAAMGLESIEGYCTTNAVWHCVQLAELAEESGEIIAITLFILALLALLRSRISMVELKIY